MRVSHSTARWRFWSWSQVDDGEDRSTQLLDAFQNLSAPKGMFLNVFTSLRTSTSSQALACTQWAPLDPCAPKARSVHFEFPSPFFAQQGSKMPKRCDQRTLGKGLHLTGFFELFSLISNTNLVGSDPHVTRNGAITFHSVCTEVIKLS